MRFSGALVQRFIWVATVVAVLFIVLYPVFWLFLTSIRRDSGELTPVFYQAAFSPLYLKALANSFIYAGIATSVALVLGIPIAWAVARSDMPWKPFISLCCSVAFVTPPVLQAMAYIFIFSPNNGLANQLTHALFGIKPFNIYTMVGMSLATSVTVFSQVFVIMVSAFGSMDASLEEAAVTSGAGRFSTALRVTIPLVRPAVATSAIMTFILVLALFGPPAIIGYPAKIYVLTTEIYRLLGSLPLRLELTAAMSVFFLVIAAFLLILQHRLLGRAKYTTIAGKSTRPKMVGLGRLRYLLLGFSLLVVTMAVFLPFATLGAISLFANWALGFSPGNVTLDNYAFTLLKQAEIQQAFKVTFMLAIVTMVGALTLGLTSGYLIAKTKMRLRGGLRYVATLSLSIPAVVFTVGVMLAFMHQPFVIYGTIWILVIGYIARFLPFAVQPLADAFGQIDDSLMEAARTSGASWVYQMRRVMVPLMGPSLFAAGFLVFMSTMRDMVTATFLASPGNETVLVRIFDRWSEGYPERATAMAVTLMVVVALFYAVFSRITRKRVV